MIDPMVKVTIACLEYEKQAAVEKLRELGTVHVSNMVQPVSEDLEKLRRGSEQLSKALIYLRNLKIQEEPKKCNPAAELSGAVAAMDEIKALEDKIAQAKKARAQLLPWGGFSEASLEALEKRGLHVVLCTAPSSRLPELAEGSAMEIIAEQAGITYFVVFSTIPVENLNVSRAPLPGNRDLAYWENELGILDEKLTVLKMQLEDTARYHYSALAEYSKVVEDEITFAQVRDGMASSKSLAYLQGYVPAVKLDSLRHAVRENSWAIRYEDIPEDDTAVPTNLIVPEKFRMAKCIFDFVGILPGYRETDVSISMLIFLSIFCGMLVGDAGYGLLFTLGVLFLRRKCKDPDKKLSLNLLLTMSISILIYGWLCGNWFAIPAEKVPFPLSGLPWLSDSKTSQQHVQLVSFFLGAFHMSMARVWRALSAVREINMRKDSTVSFLRKSREAIGHLGWGVFLWGNYGMTRLLIVKGGSIGDLEAPFIWMYIIGFILILAFNIDWSDMGTVIYMPFGFINSFVDVLSYIRLFAVGLSSMYIADSFNGMVRDLCGISYWMIPVGLIILALGHLLNIALACMGVLVHGIRLNTLEFSGHMDLSWSGKAYKPLRKNAGRCNN